MLNARIHRTHAIIWMYIFLDTTLYYYDSTICIGHVCMHTLYNFFSGNQFYHTIRSQVTVGKWPYCYMCVEMAILTILLMIVLHSNYINAHYRALTENVWNKYVLHESFNYRIIQCISAQASAMRMLTCGDLRSNISSNRMLLTRQ